MIILKFIKNTCLVFFTSLIILIALASFDDLMLFYLVFSPLYGPLGGLILTIIEYNFRPGKIGKIILTLASTLVSFFISMAFIFNIENIFS